LGPVYQTKPSPGKGQNGVVVFVSLFIDAEMWGPVSVFVFCSPDFSFFSFFLLVLLYFLFVSLAVFVFLFFFLSCAVSVFSFFSGVPVCFSFFSLNFSLCILLSLLSFCINMTCGVCCVFIFFLFFLLYFYFLF